MTKSALSGDNTCTMNNNLTMTYDVMGNITRRSDVANGAAWQYNSTHIHQVMQAGDASHTYTYDNNGNAITRAGSTITWNSANYPTQITSGAETISLSYDANRQRWKQEYTNNGQTETTIYAGGLTQKVMANGTTDYRYQIYAGNELVAVMSSQSGNNTLHYVLQDHQGSLSKITNSDGSTDVSENFTVFGDRRNPATWNGAPTSTDLNAINAVTRDGYTGQTALGSMGLNHMNGRVEDAITGRFLSADPYITEPTNTQNYNRYSYVYNNPMSYTDPTGFDASGCYGGLVPNGDRGSGSFNAVFPDPSGSKGGNSGGSNGNGADLPTVDVSGFLSTVCLPSINPSLLPNPLQPQPTPPPPPTPQQPTCPMIGSTCGTQKPQEKKSVTSDCPSGLAAKIARAMVAGGKQSAQLGVKTAQFGATAFVASSVAAGGEAGLNPVADGAVAASALTTDAGATMTALGTLTQLSGASYLLVKGDAQPFLGAVLGLFNLHTDETFGIPPLPVGVDDPRDKAVDAIVGPANCPP